MKPKEALELIDRVCASVSLNRESHVQVQQAIQILQEALDKKTK